MTGWGHTPRSSLICLLVLLGCSLGIGLLAAEKKPDTNAPASTKDAADKKPPLGEITILVPKKEFKTEGPAKALRISFDDLDIEKILNTKQLSTSLPEKMPEWMRKLDGKRLRLRGYMHPQSVYETEGIGRFILCRDTSACCFGPNPTIYYLVEVTLKKGETTKYIENRAFDVEGVFRIHPEQLEGTEDIYQFYYLDEATVVKK